MKNDITDKSRNMIFIVLIISSIIGAMLQTSLTTALPIIMQDFNISAATGQWLTRAYALAMGIMVPVTPFLLKRFLTKPLFLTGMGMYFIGLLFSSIAPSFSILLLGRVVQALGNGILLSMTQVVILTIFSPDKRGTAMGIYGLAIGAAPVLAPTITGMVIDIIDWHIIFWFALVLVAIDILLACVFMKNVLKNEKPSFDFLSLFYSALGYCGLIIGIGNLGTFPFLSFLVSLPLLVGIAMLILFSLRQLHVAEPLLELRTLKNREFRLSVIMSMLLYGVMMGGSTLFPIYIQIVHGLSATMSGLIMMPIITWGMSTTDERYTAHGTALLSSLRTIAGAVGSAVFVAIMSFATKISSNSESITANAFGINAAFFGISVLSVIQLVVAFIFVKNRQIQKNN